MSAAQRGRPLSGRAGGTFRLLLDGARCDGHGICSLCCPERIALDKWGFALVDPTPVSGRSAARAARACRACPARALELVAAEPATVRGAPRTGRFEARR